ncbi:EAL domain-containing protein [Vibrio sp. ZSDZ65]|uniref:EAL domain-containing protein n=1 Tax=Vibrio qingdaonensis TaxID=2829491 RepID=A0A9X3CK64_9VIBR|nr:EAL domain-containing protein [Vibrio qingdaonensis]MCW8344816.1 EAL domain-containing protein [Vibrio qingdaonensis]
MNVDDNYIYNNKKTKLDSSTPLEHHAPRMGYAYVSLFGFYVLSAYLFSLLSPQSQIVSLWPPAGIALAGCLLWQARFIPVIIVGSVIFNLGIQLAEGLDHELMTLPLSIGIAVGSAIQAWVNYRLLTHFSINIIDAPNLRKVSQFIVLALLCCLIASSIGSILIDIPLLENAQSTYWTTMAIWWLGDFLGVIIVTPIVLVFLHSRCRFTQTLAHYKALIYPLLLVLIALVIIQKYTDKSIQNDSINELKIHSELIEKDLNHQVENYLHSLALLARQLSGNSDITRDEFQRLALPLIHQMRGIKAFSWNPIIEQHQVEGLKAEVNKQVTGTFEIKGKPLYPEDPFVVVKWIEPFVSNEKAFGFNVFSNAARREAMIKAQNQNAPIATDIIQLVQLNKKESGFLIFSPINQGPSLSNERLTRAFNLSGFAVGVFVVGDIVTASLDNTSTHFMSVKILDMDANDDVIYHSSPSGNTTTSSAIEFSFIQHVATRNWKVILSVSPNVLALLQTHDSVTFLVYKSAFGALSVLLIITLFSNHRVLSNQVKQRTKELEASRDQLKTFAFNDSLTGLPNRRMFIDQTTHALTLAERADKIVAILFLDLNRFKHVNDSFGHDFGDQLLTQVAHNFAGNLRSSDTLARFGGDEFTILLENLTSVDQAITISKKLIHGLRTPIIINNESLIISTSIGIATYPKDGDNVHDLIRAADTAMYKAKETSSGFFCYANILRKQARAKLFIESELPQALENNQLELYFQPMIELASGQHIGCECLLRWNHPVYGVIPPDSFMPIAELSGEIIPIGAWVIEEACKTIKEWQDQGIYHQKVSVNVSVVQLMSGRLIQDVTRPIQQYGIAAELLELEVTESVLMKNIHHAITRITELKKIGVKIAIDDYGTGYSSLSYLKQLPVDSLKIDRIFIDQLNADNMTIVTSTLQMANELGLKVIAEGIQTDEQMRILVKYGCLWGQGFLFSRPLPSNRYIAFCLLDNDRSAGHLSLRNI